MDLSMERKEDRSNKKTGVSGDRNKHMCGGKRGWSRRRTGGGTETELILLFDESA